MIYAVNRWLVCQNTITRPDYKWASRKDPQIDEKHKDRKKESLKNLHSIRERYPQTRKLSGWVGKKRKKSKQEDIRDTTIASNEKEKSKERERERKWLCLPVQCVGSFLSSFLLQSLATKTSHTMPTIINIKSQPNILGEITFDHSYV